MQASNQANQAKNTNTKTTIDAEIRTKFHQQAEMLANRVKKRFKHLHKRFVRRNIEVFRLYDWDIPEIRAVVDWYAGDLVVGEYMRQQSVPEWLPMMGEAVSRALDVPTANLHLKQRRAGAQDGKRYERFDHSERKRIVAERDLRFYVNLSDFVDTGLFSDHRETRRMVREMAEGADFLNLYCYTATFSCYAAKGGARSTVSVDRAETVLAWARDNMDLNGIPVENNEMVQADTFDFLKRAKRDGRAFDLAVVDPPSYSTTQSRNAAFDILNDHPRLLAETLAVMKPGGVIFFSTNHQDFHPRFEELPNMVSADIVEIREITDATVPEDYARKRQPIHRCWRMTV